MKVKLLVTTILFSIYIYSGSVAALSSELLIVEIQTESDSSASEEVIKIRNNTNKPYLLDGLALQYKSSNGSGWSNRASLSGEVASLAVVELSTSDGTLSSGMASAGGHIRLYNSEDSSEYDLVGWGEAGSPLVEAAEAHAKGGKLLRRQDTAGLVVNTGNNAQDFYADNPVVQLEDSGDEQSAKNEPDASASDGLEGSIKRLELQSTEFPQLRITELMPDPVSPLQDSDDEFIELYNPNSVPVNIDGYIINIEGKGKGFRLPSFTLQPGGYLAVFSEDSGLTLGNSSGVAVGLSAPNGKTVHKTALYEKAPPGEAFIESNGSWLWTTKPTPSEVNSYVAKQDTASTNAASDDDNESDESEGQVLSSSDDRDYDESSQRDVYQPPETVASSKTNFLLLAIVGSLGLIYAVWEYRNDLANTVHKLRRYVSSS